MPVLFLMEFYELLEYCEFPKSCLLSNPDTMTNPNPIGMLTSRKMIYTLCFPRM